MRSIQCHDQCCFIFSISGASLDTPVVPFRCWPHGSLVNCDLRPEAENPRASPNGFGWPIRLPSGYVVPMHLITKESGCSDTIGSPTSAQVILALVHAGVEFLPSLDPISGHHLNSTPCMILGLQCKVHSQIAKNPQ